MTRNTMVPVALILAVAPAFAETFQVAPGEPNLVRFESKAALETFDGKTRQVRGHVRFDPADLGDWIEVHIEVDMASFDTGIDIRNRHMRENHLETDKHPTATFKGGKVHDASHSAIGVGTPVAFEIEGVLSLHGVEKPLRAPIEMSLETDEGGPRLRVTTSFQVKLADYDIKRPKFLFMKLGESQRVTVELVAKPGE